MEQSLLPPIFTLLKTTNNTKTKWAFMLAQVSMTSNWHPFLISLPKM